MPAIVTEPELRQVAADAGVMVAVGAALSIVKWVVLVDTLPMLSVAMIVRVNWPSTAFIVAALIVSE